MRLFAPIRRLAGQPCQTRLPNIHTPWTGRIRQLACTPRVRITIKRQRHVASSPYGETEELYPNSERRIWSDEEIDTIAKLPDEPLRNLVKLFPGRNMESVEYMRERLRHETPDDVKAAFRDPSLNCTWRPWTACEVALLEEHLARNLKGRYLAHELRLMASKLGRTSGKQ